MSRQQIEMVWKMGPTFLLFVILSSTSSASHAAALSKRAEPFTLTEAAAAHSTMRLESNALVVAPGGGSYVAWVEGPQLLVASLPQLEPRVLASDEAGQALGAVHASPDGRWLYYVRGDARPAFGPYASQDSREMWRVSVEGGAPQLLAQGAEVPSGPPVFAPDGRSFVTAEGPMLFVHEIEGDRLRRRPLLRNDPQHYAAVRLTSIKFSPDGRQLAFVSWRKAGHSYVAILDVDSGSYRYLDPGIFRDLSPVWSPDGREVAFVRQPGNWTREYRFTPLKQGVPWSLMTADAAEGRVRTRWRADVGPGSVFQPFGEGVWMEGQHETTQLIWTASGQILFPWEKTGWLSLYSLSASRGPPRLLTPGAGEVALPRLSADGHSVIYAATHDDPARLHLWRVAVNGGAPEQLTRGRGVEHSPKALSGGSVAYIGNDNGRMPNFRRVLRTDADSLTLTPNEKELGRNRGIWAQFADVEVVALAADDGVVSHHLLMVPRGSPPRGGYPVVVASKGGPTGRVSPGNAANTALGQYMVSQGYIFVEINYRGCTGFGLDYRLPEGRGATGGSEVRDLEALALFLKDRPDVDPERIGIMGGSYGGHLVGLALSRLPQHYAAGAHLSGVSDWVIEMKKDDLDGWASAPPEFIRLSERMQIEDLAFESSPPAHIENWKAPTLFTVGELDTAGHMESIIDLGHRLMEQGVHVEFSIAPEAGHSGPRARPPEKVFDFFQRMLRERQAAVQGQ